MFVRAGAGLDADGKAAARGDQRAARDDRHRVRPERARRRAGLHAGARRRGRSRRPARLRARGGAKAAAERGLPGKHVITLSRSSIEPFLQFSTRRDLREKAFQAWIARGEGGGATDNRALIAEMVALRAERARLLGFASFAALPARRHDGEDAGGGARACSIASGRRRARSALRRATPCRRWCRRKAAISSSRLGLAPLRREGAQGRVRFRRGELKPYLPLDRMIEAAFDTADRLFGLSFERARRHPGLTSRRARLGGARRAKAGHRRPVPRRLFRPRRPSGAAPG